MVLATMDASSLSYRTDALTNNAVLGLRAAMDAVNTRRVVLVCDPLPNDSSMAIAEARGLQIQRIRLTGVAQKWGPYLIDVPDESKHESFVNDSLRLAVTEALQPSPWNKRFRSMCAWLITTKSLSELEVAIRSHSYFTDGNGGRRTLRLWDPRTMQHVRRWHTPTVTGSVFIDVGWGFVDSFGGWNMLSPATKGEQGAPPTAQILRECSLANAALQRLSALGLWSEPSVWASLQDAIFAAQKEGLSDDDDVAWFAADRVRLCAPLERASALANLFSAIKQGKGRYIRATGDYDDTDWMAVVQSIPSIPSTKGETL